MVLLSNFVSIIKNNIRLNKDFADVPYSLLIQKCLILLLNEGFILGFVKKTSKIFRVFLKYYKGKSVITEIKCISVPGFRKYIKIKDLIKNYNPTTFLILSTSNGVVSNFELFLWNNKKNILNNIINIKENNSFNNHIVKTVIFNNIESGLFLNYSYSNNLKINLNSLLFQRKMALLGYYRPTGVLSKLSKRQYLRNFNLKRIFLNYLTYNKFNNSFNVNKLHMVNNLFFFKFKLFFKSFKYLNFNRSKTFYQFIKRTNKSHLYSIFYFLFYLKQLNFSKYKYRFSLYIKYMNHLIKLNNFNKKNYNTISKSISGGELLLSVN